MSNRNFDASIVTGRLRDKNVAQQIYGAMRNGRAAGNPQTMNANASIMPEYNEGVETVVELGLGAKYTFDLGGIANYVTVVPTATVPGAPTNVLIAAALNGDIEITFTAPTNIGSSPILLYTATSLLTGITGTSPTTLITISSPPSGTYRFTVVATNSAGDSIPSLPSNQIII